MENLNMSYTTLTSKHLPRKLQRKRSNLLINQRMRSPNAKVTPFNSHLVNTRGSRRKQKRPQLKMAEATKYGRQVMNQQLNRAQAKLKANRSIDTYDSPKV